MRSLFYDIHRTVTNAVNKAGFPIMRVLSFLGIPRSWYYAQLSIKPLLDGRFNPFAVSDEEWLVIGFKRREPKASFREIAYTLMDEDLAYFSPGTVYNILKKNNLITPWKHQTWASTRPEHAKHLMNAGRRISCMSK